VYGQLDSTEGNAFVRARIMVSIPIRPWKFALLDREGCGVTPHPSANVRFNAALV